MFLTAVMSLFEYCLIMCWIWG